MLDKFKKLGTGKKIFYLLTMVSVLLFLIGLLVIQTDYYSYINQGSRDSLDIITFMIPFAIWAWLIIIGMFFVKKNWLVNTILIALAIPHLILIAVVYAHSTSVLEVLSWYVMILSFGLIII